MINAIDLESMENDITIHGYPAMQSNLKVLGTELMFEAMIERASIVAELAALTADVLPRLIGLRNRCLEMAERIDSLAPPPIGVGGEGI